MKKIILLTSLILSLTLLFCACKKKDNTHVDGDSQIGDNAPNDDNNQPGDDDTTDTHECTPVADAGKSATCTEDGLTEGSHCSECGKTLTAQTTIPALGHHYAHQIVLPSCTAEGYTKYVCMRCPDTYNDDIKAMTAHRFNDGGCLFCEMDAPTDVIEATTEWYADGAQIAFTIYTKEELAGFAQLVDSGVNFTNKIVQLGADIDLGYLEWKPIGSERYKFSGTFDGMGHTISNLRIGATDENCVGLFANSTGKISNLTIDNATIYVSGIRNYVGILCGYTTADISNVTVDGYVDAKNSNYVGGIAGVCSAQLTNLSSDTDIVAVSKIGGIAGYSAVGTSMLRTLKNYGDIVSNNGNQVGGIIGDLSASGTVYFENLDNYGTITANEHTGGIVGLFQCSGNFNIESCTNYADIKGSAEVGGLFGYFRRYNTSDTVIAQKAVNHGNVSGTGHWVGGIFGRFWSIGTTKLLEMTNYGNITGGDESTGGIAGHVDFVNVTLENLTNEGNVTGPDVHVGGIFGYVEECTDMQVSYVKNFGNINGTSRVSGIFGYVKGVGTPNISNVENSGNVTATGERVGGIAGFGYFENPIVENIVNKGNVTANGLYVGGIFGYMEFRAPQITNIMNLGEIKGSQYVGGTFGLVTCTGIMTAAALDNRGNVTAIAYASGLFGYVKGAVGSVIKSSSSCSAITAEYLIGAIAAEAVNTLISDCRNDGSTINATACLIQGSSTYAYVGGFVGKGYTVEKCVNHVSINYVYTGSYLGGIAGYLTLYATECENRADISGTDYVGGIAGYINTPSTATLKDLKNAANITGRNYVGGIVGRWDSGNTFVLTDCENSGNITATGYVGGITGGHYGNASHGVSMKALKNTGDVTATEGVAGGIFGYVSGKTGNNETFSRIEECSSSADIVARHTVGGLIGEAYAIILKDSTNKGSTVTATGFRADGTSLVYLGGYMGIGAGAENLVNDVDINYNNFGECVGGIVGYINTAAYTLTNCTNNASITSRGNKVGGICGHYNYGSGNSSPTWNVLNNLVNNGNVTGKGDVGGIFGYFYTWGNGGYVAAFRSAFFTNLGEISGETNVGEMFGYYFSDGASTLTDYTVLGHVTVLGEIVEDSDVGSNSGLTLSERKVYSTEKN